MKLLKLLLAFALLLMTGACTPKEAISAEIRGTKLSAEDAKALYEAYEALKKEEVQQMKDTRLIGGGDIDIVFTVGDKRISVTGQSIFGMFVLEDGISFADPFDAFFDINRKLREKIGLANCVMGVAEDAAIIYDANDVIGVYVDDWQHDNRYSFGICVAGKNAPMSALRIAGLNSDQYNTISELYDSYGTDGTVEYNYLKIKKINGINLATDENDTVYLIKLIGK